MEELTRNILDAAVALVLFAFIAGLIYISQSKKRRGNKARISTYIFFLGVPSVFATLVVLSLQREMLPELIAPITVIALAFQTAILIRVVKAK